MAWQAPTCLSSLNPDMTYLGSPHELSDGDSTLYSHSPWVSHMVAFIILGYHHHQSEQMEYLLHAYSIVSPMQDAGDRGKESTI